MAGRGLLVAVLRIAVLAGLLMIGGCTAREPIGGTAYKVHSGTLWDIVSTCVDREGLVPDAPLCQCAPFVHSCCGDRATPNDAVVWTETAHFVAIRDLKMCGCDAPFVAGLALPRTRVTGIEDPARPEDIWSFAWRVARDRIPDDLEIALVINPIQARSQNQMHVHMLRLRPGARAELEAAAQVSGMLAEPPGTIVQYLANLDAVFADTLAQVGAAQMGDHGILIARARDGGFLSAITDRRSPQALTVNGCRTQQPPAT
jgi:CDP-diacylglycerol pyrophosphatase